MTQQSRADGFDMAQLSRLPPPSEGPLQVGVGIQINQITGVNQQEENFGVVGTLVMQLNLPRLAFADDDSTQDYRRYRPDEFVELATEQGITLPAFLLQNQQGRRFVQQAIVMLQSDGNAAYVERFSATLQAPHFNFRRYPFDKQTFYVEISSLFPRNFVEFFPLEDQSGLGGLLGEEEWVLYGAQMETKFVTGFTGLETSQIALRFEGRRHIVFYVLRLMLPLMIILMVSWATFFLQEYRRRIDMASANLLVFVAFNFAISTTLPKLGYLTFIDSLLVGMFVITGSMVLVNIALRRLKINDREALARKIDRYLVVWIYPAIHAGFLFWAVKFYLI
ncbi:ligand-gated ion channel [Shimia gijangensis]|nr:hypothetical protein [Shimia gijangensis]